MATRSPGGGHLVHQHRAGGRRRAGIPRTSVSIPPFRPSFSARLWAAVAENIDHTSGWWRLPVLTGAAVLEGLRTRLRQQNLHDTETMPRVKPPAKLPEGGGSHGVRSVDGSFNDLDVPEMGRAGSRFGRNVPVEATVVPGDDVLLTPNPRTVSRRLLTRARFIRASRLTLLAAAWLQFMGQDGSSHGKNSKHEPGKIGLSGDDPWPHRRMTILRPRRAPSSPPGDNPPSFVNL